MTLDSQQLQPVTSADGEQLRIGSWQLTVLMSAAATNGAYLMVETVVAPRLLSLPHEHADEDQVIYVLEGTMGFRTGEEEFVAGPGAAVLRPRRIPHALWNPTDIPARMLEITSPGTIEPYFREADALTRSGAADPQALRRLGERYGQIPVPDWIDELTTSHGVSLDGRSVPVDAGEPR